MAEPLQAQFHSTRTFVHNIVQGGPEIATQSVPVTTVQESHLNQHRKRVTGRIISLSNIEEGALDWMISGRSLEVSTGSVVAISFPSMPETIELARESEYRVAPVYMAPDGIHQYLNTKPLEIPISFVLSIHDREYAPHGALTLLATAAKLHSLALPVGSDRNNRVVNVRMIGAIYNEASASNGKSTSATPALDSRATTAASADAKAKELEASLATSEVSSKPEGLRGYWGGESSTYPPVAAILDLISDGREASISLGVSCIGYVSRVRTRFKGPWLQPPNGGKNMPSLLECEFTFVHYPSYTNRFQQNTGDYDQTLVNAYAEEVRSNFYNMAEKSVASNVNPEAPNALDGPYRGLSY